MTIPYNITCVAILWFFSPRVGEDSNLLFLAQQFDIYPKWGVEEVLNSCFRKPSCFKLPSYLRLEISKSIFHLQMKTCSFLYFGSETYSPVSYLFPQPKCWHKAKSTAKHTLHRRVQPRVGKAATCYAKHWKPPTVEHSYFLLMRQCWEFIFINNTKKLFLGGAL